MSKLCMLYDLIAFKSYICFVFQNLSIYDLYVILLAYTSYPSIIRFSSGFHVFQKLLSQFGLGMSDLWSGHIQLTRHIRLPAQTYLALGLRGIYKGDWVHLGTLALFLHLLFISCGSKASPRQFWIFSTKSFSS
jgi:hypothetical protein